MEKDKEMTLFFQMLQIGLSGSFAVFYLLLIRLLLSRIPKRVTYILWGLVVVHLISPIQIISKLGVIPQVNIIEGLKNINVDWLVIVIVYLIGIIALLTINIIQYYKLLQKLKRQAVQIDSAGRTIIYSCEEISSAFTYGFFSPKIYLPVGLDDESRKLIVLHEETHIKRGDYLIKLIVYILCVLNWYNPLIWLGFYFFVRDQETSCDEIVLKKVGAEHKKEYANVILKAASGFFTSGDSDHSLAFGEVNIKYRIRHCVKIKEHSKIKSFCGLVLTMVTLLFGLFVSEFFKIELNNKNFNTEITEAEELNDVQVFESIILASGETYQIRSNGIVLVANGNEQLIYKGRFYNSNNLLFDDEEILFLSDNSTCIQRIDINIKKPEKIFQCEDNKTIKKFKLIKGVLKITYNDGSTESRKLSVNNKYSAAAKDILANKGKFYNVSQWKDDKVYAYVDLNADGKDEKIVLDYSLSDKEKNGIVKYNLQIGNKTVTKQANDVGNKLYAVSFDGYKITIALEYLINDSDSDKSQWFTSFYQYQDGVLRDCGELETETSRIEFSEDNIIANDQVNVIIQESVKRKYKFDMNGRVTSQINEYMEVDNVSYELLNNLIVYEEPEGEKTFTISPQNVEVNLISVEKSRKIGTENKTGNWVQLTCQDGIKGWIFVSAGVLPETGEETANNFKQLVYTHSHPSSGNLVPEK